MAPAGARWVIVDTATIEKPFGWVFFYNSERFLATGDVIYALAGNGPVFVNKHTESVDFFGSIPTLDVLLADYESKLGQSL